LLSKKLKVTVQGYLYHHIPLTNQEFTRTASAGEYLIFNMMFKVQTLYPEEFVLCYFTKYFS